VVAAPTERDGDRREPFESSCVSRAMEGTVMHGLRWLGLATLVLAAACASSKPASDFELAIGDGGVTMELSRAAVVALLQEGLDSTIECGGDPDAELHALLSPLANRRSGSSSLTDGDGRLSASRRGSRLRITVADDHVERLRVTLPWSFAECVLGEPVALADALDSGPITVVYRTDEGKRVTARLR
jgi:hypothetical protein